MWLLSKKPFSFVLDARDAKIIGELTMSIGLILIQILFGIYGILLVAFSFWSKKNIKGKGNSELFNELLLAALFFIIVFLLPDVFKPTQTTPEQANVFFNVMFLALAIEGIIFAYMLINAYYKTQKDPVRKEKMNYAKYMEDFIENYVDNPKKDIQRKGLHVLPVVIIIAFYHISYHLSDVGVLYLDIDQLGFYYFLVFTVALHRSNVYAEDLCRIGIALKL